MKNNKLLKKIYKHRWLIITIYIIIASISILLSFLSLSYPKFKYEVRCIDVSSEYLSVIDTLKHKNELTFCEDDLKEENLTGFYVKHSDFIYLGSDNPEFKKTIYHEYSHFLMAKKVKNTNVKKLIKDMGLTDEKLTDITAFFLLLENEKEDLYNVNVNQFNYILADEWDALDNPDFWKYINEIYTIEGFEEVPLKTFDKWIKSTNKYTENNKKLKGL